VLDILIVEDNTKFREMLRATLQSGYPLASVSVAPEGGTALRKISERAPDLVFMEIRMPGKSGLVLTKEIKQRFKDIVIVVLTNLDSSEYREAAFASGADFFLSKESATAEDLQELVKKIAAKRS
jgi:DNA-binding NarL/FixJ family response regulator